MKIKDKTFPGRYKNFAVTVPTDLVLEIEQRAAQAELSVSAYLRRLIKTDLITLKKT